MNKHVISATVKNHSGVLTRISGLFSRRGYNIDSLSVCTTQDENVSRMTIVAIGTDDDIEQIVKQLEKQEDVVNVFIINQNNSVIRELLLVKISVLPSQRPEVESTCTIYRAKIVDLSPQSVIIELTGEGSKIDGFIKIISPYGILELVRTGLTALER